MTCNQVKTDSLPQISLTRYWRSRLHQSLSKFFHSLPQGEREAADRLAFRKACRFAMPLRGAFFASPQRQQEMLVKKGRVGK